ncbi:hypothetical protein RF11_13813 [Thelohanellus kitauei]|uniref:Uncharacterized protein n=1 Tax=Thelohanellus kitauei TaxID=669202 RepID=A0A0C2J050_THEKT|nr:hypothetical protein RF11_13813 [Thelohanellus kitauei]
MSNSLVLVINSQLKKHFFEQRFGTYYSKKSTDCGYQIDKNIIPKNLDFIIQGFKRIFPERKQYIPFFGARMSTLKRLGKVETELEFIVPVKFFFKDINMIHGIS